MKQAGSGAEHDAVGQHPAHPERQLQALVPRRPAVTPPHGEAADQRQREEPADLGRERRRDEAQWPSRHIVAPQHRRRGLVRTRVRIGRSRRGLAHAITARHKAFNEIFTDDQFEHRIVAGTVDKRPPLSRRQIVGEAPGQRHRARHSPCLHQLAKPAPKRLLRPDHPDQRKGRHYTEGDQHLDVEADAHERGGKQQETRSVGLDGPAQSSGGEQQGQHQPALGAVRAVDRDADRVQRQEQRR